MKPFQQHVMEERLRKLLAVIAKNVGLADELRTDDLGRVYFPTVLAQERFIRDAERQLIFKSLQGQNAAEAGAQGLQNTTWPPKPD